MADEFPNFDLMRYEFPEAYLSEKEEFYRFVERGLEESTSQGGILKRTFPTKSGSIDFSFVPDNDYSVLLIHDQKGKIIEKRNVKLPSEVNGILDCLNPKCITNKEREPLKTKFIVKENPLRLRCAYCNKEFEGLSLLKA